MRRVRQAIVVEGKHDEIRVRSAVDALVVCTDGFRIFKDREKMALLRRLAAVRRLIVLTDSDTAGGVIRNHLLSCIPADQLLQAYIPPIKGKEKRKKVPSAEGTLGVEGMEAELLYDLLSPFENKDFAEKIRENPLSKTDLYIDGLTGGADSAAARDELASKLDLPRGMSANALLAALKILVTYEEYLSLVGREKEVKS